MDANRRLQNASQPANLSPISYTELTLFNLSPLTFRHSPPFFLPK